MGIILLCGYSQGTDLTTQPYLNVDLYVDSVKNKHIKHGLGFLYKIQQMEEGRERLNILGAKERLD